MLKQCCLTSGLVWCIIVFNRFKSYLLWPEDIFWLTLKMTSLFRAQKQLVESAITTCLEPEKSFFRASSDWEQLVWSLIRPWEQTVWTLLRACLVCENSLFRIKKKKEILYLCFRHYSNYVFKRGIPHWGSFYPLKTCNCSTITEKTEFSITDELLNDHFYRRCWRK